VSLLLILGPLLSPIRVRLRLNVTSTIDCRRAGLSAALFLLALTAIGCSGARGELVKSGFGDSDREDVELAMADGMPATAPAVFAFQAPDLYTGAMVDGADLYDNAPLIITFVVPSCAVCLVEGPKLAAAAEATAEVNYVVIHSHGAVEDYLAYNQQADLTQENVSHLVDTEAVLWARFGVSSQPSTVLVSGDGTVRSARGALGDDGLRRALAYVTG